MEYFQHWKSDAVEVDAASKRRSSFITWTGSTADAIQYIESLLCALMWVAI